MLDGRLATIASLVRKGSRVADVGCDHGHLICSLVLTGIATGGVACDIKPNPLKKAKAEVERLGLQNEIVCRLGNGLKTVLEEEIDDIVIAGMGGEAIIGILSDICWKEQKEKRFILQPMTKTVELRRWLLENGYEIIREKASFAAERYYTVMKVGYTGRQRVLDEDDPYLYIGELRHAPSNEAKQYLHIAFNAVLKRAAGQEKNAPAYALRLVRLADAIKAVIKEMDRNGI